MKLQKWPQTSHFVHVLHRAQTQVWSDHTPSNSQWENQTQSNEEEKHSKRWREVQQVSGRTWGENKKPNGTVTSNKRHICCRTTGSFEAQATSGTRCLDASASNEASDTATTRLWTNVDRNKRGKIHSDWLVDFSHTCTKTNNPLRLCQ